MAARGKKTTDMIPASDRLWETTVPFSTQGQAQNQSTRTKKSGKEAEIILPESDESTLLGDPIDGSEDDISALESDNPAPSAVAVGGADCDPAVTAAVRAAATATKKKKESADMAEATKAELIREEIRRRKEKGEETIRPRDIIAALAERGVTVTAPQVSITLRDFGKTSKKTADTVAANGKPAKEGKTSKRATAKVAAVDKPRKAAKAAGSENWDYATLSQAGDFLAQVGGLERAKNLLDAYAKLFHTAS